MHTPPSPATDFLNRVGRKLRESRPLVPASVNYTVRREVLNGAPFVSVWFRTRGCRFDAQGSCTSCNYSRSTTPSVDEMVQSVVEGIDSAHLDSTATLLLSATGNMFDDWEVPAAAREAIFEHVRAMDTAAVLCESRIETLADETVARFAGVFDDRLAGIGIGVESTAPHVLKYCANKQVELVALRQAVATMAAYKVQSSANVLLGVPFLSEAESIDDACRSLETIIDLGIDQAILFPILVRPHTVTGWLWGNGLYDPCSLWSLVEVLLRLGPERTRKVTISWYKDYYGDDTRPEAQGALPVLAAPTTCPECIDAVMEHLDGYRDSSDLGVLRDLDSLSCSCRDAWRRRIAAPPSEDLATRLIRAYELMGRDVLGDEWWETRGGDVVSDVGLGAC